MITLSKSDYQKRVFGCWLGKAIGGTLGMPYEGHEGSLDLTFYDPVPTEVAPNDDLDLQVLWAELLDRHGPHLGRIELARGWLEHTDFPWDEYGSALANFARGIFPPASGHHSNYFGDCMGSPIRSEIWACLAPCDPELACRLAYEDAILDHDGEGIWGELFLVALESAAFVTQDRDALIKIGLSVIPENCKIARAVRSTINWYSESSDWRTVRGKILAEFGHYNFTDAPQNVAFAILGWLAGQTFGEALCITVNCGKDTDCSGATLGALLGILSPAAIEDKWKAPISQKLLLSPNMKNMNPPKTIDDFARMTIRLAERMLTERSGRVRLGDGPTTSMVPEKLTPFAITDPADSILLSSGPLRILAIYPNGLTFIPGQSLTIVLRLTNQAGKDLTTDLHLDLPAGWALAAGQPGPMSLKAGEVRDMPFIFSCPDHLRMYHEYIILRFGEKSIGAEYRLPVVSGWQWEFNVNGKKEILWMPERVLVPIQTQALNIKPRAVVKASTKFHFPRRQRVRFTLASNGSGTMTLDGKKIVDYSDALFEPMAHRAPEKTCHIFDLAFGLHTLEVTLKFDIDKPQAVLLLSDGLSNLLIHDVTVATDLRQ